MNTINHLNQQRLLSEQDSIKLKELAKGNENIPIIEPDKEMNENLLRAVVEHRVNYDGS